jgi:two-component system OmpR family sensor kinase
MKSFDCVSCRERGGTPRPFEMKDDAFTLAVSHELRTLITICRGHLDVLEPGAGEREVRDVKETLLSVLSLMTRVVEDLTGLERLDGRVELKMKTLWLDEFVGLIAKQVEPILGKRLAIESGAAGARIVADPQRLTQALLNLLRNAAEHAQGDLPVRLRVERELSGCRFEVADEGEASRQEKSRSCSSPSGPGRRPRREPAWDCRSCRRSRGLTAGTAVSSTGRARVRRSGSEYRGQRPSRRG